MRIGLAYNEKPAQRAAGEPPNTNDAYVEWDEPGTIEAVAHALAPLGDVIRLEADAFFPQKLALARPDILFNMAEGLHGPCREAHVPAICEYMGVPYTGSDPLTLALALHKGRAKEVLAFRGVATAPFADRSTHSSIGGSSGGAPWMLENPRSTPPSSPNEPSTWMIRRSPDTSAPETVVKRRPAFTTEPLISTSDGAPGAR